MSDELSVAWSPDGRWVVHSPQEDGPDKAYKVDLVNSEDYPTCSCKHGQTRNSDTASDACKHIEQVVKTLTANPTESMVEAARSMAYRESLEAPSPAAEPADASGGSQPGESGGSSESPDQGASDNPVEAVTDALDSAGVPTDKMRIWEHPEYGSVQFTTDERLDTGEFDALKAFCDRDVVQYDSESGNNYVRSGDVEEVTV